MLTSAWSRGLPLERDAEARIHNFHTNTSNSSAHETPPDPRCNRAVILPGGCGSERNAAKCRGESSLSHHQRKRQETLFPQAQNATCNNTIPSSARLDIVIAHYHEDGERTVHLLEEITQHPCLLPWAATKVTLLCKTTKEDFDSLRSHKGFEQFSMEWVLLNNTGREGDSYLRYILNNFHALPDYVFFSQAELHERDSLNKRLHRFSSSVHFMSLSVSAGWEGKIEGHHDRGIGCSCDEGCFGHVETSPVFFQLYAMSAKRLCPPGHVFPAFWNGQFVVRREGILRHDRNFYEYLLYLVNGECGMRLFHIFLYIHRFPF